MTLSKEKGGFDFNLSKFGPRSPVDTYTMHYGKDGTGDITNTDNMRAFEKYVKRNIPHSQGVHTVMTDGGFGIARGKENLQEFLHRRLILCQITLSMALLRPGGRMCIKVFDTFLPFTNGLFYLVRSCFEKTSVFKPYSSRPANSERYLVAEGRFDEDIVRPVVEYLWSVNDKMGENEKIRAKYRNYSSNFTATSNSASDDEELLDVNDVVPLNIMTQDEAFVKFMKSHNDVFSKLQISSLEKIVDFVKNTSLQGEPREQIREECLREFGLDGMEERDARMGQAGLHSTNDLSSSAPEIAFRAIQRRNDHQRKGASKSTNYREMASKIRRLERTHISGEKPYLRKIGDWMVMPAVAERRCFVLGRGPRFQVVTWTLNGGTAEWVPLQYSLPAGTLLLASLTHNPRFEDTNRAQVTTAAVVLDAAMLGEMDIQNLSFKQRMGLVSRFADCLYREVDEGNAFGASRFPVLPLVVHRPVPFSNIVNMFHRFDEKSQLFRTSTKTDLSTSLLETFSWNCNSFVLICTPTGSFRNSIQYQLVCVVKGLHSNGLTERDFSAFLEKFSSS